MKILISVTAILLYFFGCNSNPTNAELENDFSIYLTKVSENNSPGELSLEKLVTEDEPILSIKSIEFYEWKNHKIRFSDEAKKRIQSKEPLFGRFFIVVALNQRIYWGNSGSTSGNSNKIVSVDRAGANQDEIDIDTSSHGSTVCGTNKVVINSNDGKLYYSLSWYSVIKRQNLDGTNVEVLIDGEASSNDCNCFDIDQVNNHIYYTDATGNINRADLDGGNIATIIPNTNQIFDIAVY